MRISLTAWLNSEAGKKFKQAHRDAMRFVRKYDAAKGVSEENKWLNLYRDAAAERDGLYEKFASY